MQYNNKKIIKMNIMNLKIIIKNNIFKKKKKKFLNIKNSKKVIKIKNKTIIAHLTPPPRKR